MCSIDVPTADNWLKNLGFTIVRNPDGTWTLRRPNGTIVGWRAHTPIAGN